ncbi:hypothetical protein M3M38_06425 [Fructilactobacillus cliffordii]|uniref:hypothetical protein n=1 Tax=Fructilactobacillus cliffordii TaxID=2940299 RepID=UPI002093BB08|nr:hypothetical protein [Fructilactobacillus cliffordii]USS86318.1 hypothetical protein M3M38_06425 [Fructilactobacillus cliffordii]
MKKGNNSKIVFAVAGSGKTTEIGKEISYNKDKNNLLITFTNQNVENIKIGIQKFCDEGIPENTIVLTYTKFLYYWLIIPFKKIIKVGKDNFCISEGITIETPEPQRINGKSNHKYRKNDDYRHYVNRNKQLYASRLSELFNNQKACTKKLIIKRLNYFTDNIYIDEFQDFTGKDFDLLMQISDYLNDAKLTMFGDFFQSQVSMSDQRNLSPYKEGNFDKFKFDLKTKHNIAIDENSLKRSYRCPPKTCDFIRDNLGINIFSKSNGDGEVTIEKDSKRITEILNDKNIVKLYWNSNHNEYGNFEPYNKWGYSKGDTYNNVAIILTKTVKTKLRENNLYNLNPKTKNSFYVALTRSKGNTYLICN